MSWHSEYIINKTWKRGRWLLGIDWRSNNSFMGRFGGGWQWKVGIQASSSTVIISLLVFSIRLSWYKK